MSYLNRQLILECLNELRDRQFQEELWLGRIPSRQSSFDEAVEGLFTDSGLEEKLTGRKTGFTEETESVLLELRLQLSQVRANNAPEVLIDDPAMSRVRYLAGKAWELLEHDMA